MLDAAPICDGVSDEMSVCQRKDGKYVMIFQRGGLSPKIGMRDSQPRRDIERSTFQRHLPCMEEYSLPFSNLAH